MDARRWDGDARREAGAGDGVRVGGRIVGLAVGRRRGLALLCVALLCAGGWTRGDARNEAACVRARACEREKGRGAQGKTPRARSVHAFVYRVRRTHGIGILMRSFDSVRFRSFVHYSFARSFIHSYMDQTGARGG